MDVMSLSKTERISPSRIVKCPRNAFMESLGYPAPVPPDLQETFDEGTRRHVQAQANLRALGFNCPEKEYVVMTDDPPMYGKVDGFISIDDAPAIFEMKTTSRHPSSISRPFSIHEDQTQLYMHMVQADRALIYYQSKIAGLLPTERGKFFLTQYDPKRAEELLERGRYVLWCITNRVLPLPECYRCDNPSCMDKRVHKKLGVV